MSFQRSIRLFPVIMVMALMMTVLTVASTAFAFGSFSVKPTTVQEVDGRWKIHIDIDYGSKPHLGHIPFDFVFVQTAYYENTIGDNDPKPVQRRKEMRNQPPQREQMDIGFADARGELWRKTKFSFSLRRDRGFSAGEYTLTLKQSSDGRMLGRPVKLILNGENELIDRRSLDFSVQKKSAETGKKVDKEVEDKSQADSVNETDTDDDERSSASSGDDSVSHQRDEQDHADGPPPVDPSVKRGCGCRIEHLSHQSRSGAWLAIIALAGVAVVLRCTRK